MRNTSCPRIRVAARTAAAFLSVAALLSTAACSFESAAADGPELTTDGVVIITNSRSNVPEPALSSGNAALISDVVRAGLPVAVVSAEGTPVPVDKHIPEVTGNNRAAREASLETALQVVHQAIAPMPRSEGANGYGAFAVARDAAASMQLVNPTIICLACGLDTRGGLNLTGPDALLAAPEAYIEYLEASGQLVNFGDGFDEVQVILTSTGATASPQEPLDAGHITLLTAIWHDVLTAGGAVVRVDPYPLAGESIPAEYPVPTVELPALSTPPPVDVCEPQSFDFDGASDARFHPETDEWVDEAAAREALRPLAEWLQEDLGRTARIQGTTAGVESGLPDEGIELSKSRAQKAAQLLIVLGVEPEQIHPVEGLGPNYPGRVEDRDERGNPIPSERTKNRKVIVTLEQNCT